MKIGIIGSGAYGIALAHLAYNNNNDVIVWSHREEEANDLNKNRISSKLPDYKIPEGIAFSYDLEKCIKGKDLIVMAVPAYAFEETIQKMVGFIYKKTPILIATKGIQQNTCLFLHDVLKKYLVNKVAIIAGPTFASDIIKDSPICFSLATKSKKVESIINNCFASDKVKFRRTKDIIGVEICASVKNVMAIASGILEGMGVTDSTRALFLTESLNDIKELIHALGGKKKTILSFAGFGDILMTCTSHTSRNFNFGYIIGKGANSKEIDEYLNNNTVEGMYTLKSIHKLVRKKKVKMPIINLIYNIILGKKEKEELLKFLIKK